jgi:hypothetical protein
MTFELPSKVIAIYKNAVNINSINIGMPHNKEILKYLHSAAIEQVE